MQLLCQLQRLRGRERLQLELRGFGELHNWLDLHHLRRIVPRGVQHPHHLRHVSTINECDITTLVVCL